MKQASIIILSTALLLGCSSDKESAEFRQAVEQTNITEQLQADAQGQEIATPAISFAGNDASSEQQVSEPASSEEVAALAQANDSTIQETDSQSKVPASAAASAPETAAKTPSAIIIKVRSDDTLNVRKDAGIDHEIMDKLPPGSKVAVTGNKKALPDKQVWQEVITPKGVTGWVNKHYLKFNP